MEMILWIVRLLVNIYIGNFSHVYNFLFLSCIIFIAHTILIKFKRIFYEIFIELRTIRAIEFQSQ